MIQLLATATEALPCFQPGLTGKAHRSTTSAGLTKLDGDPAAKRTIGQHMVHALGLRVVRLILYLHLGLPPIPSLPDTGEGEPQGNPCAV